MQSSLLPCLPACRHIMAASPFTFVPSIPHALAFITLQYPSRSSVLLNVHAVAFFLTPLILHSSQPSRPACRHIMAASPITFVPSIPHAPAFIHAVALKLSLSCFSIILYFTQKKCFVIKITKQIIPHCEASFSYTSTALSFSAKKLSRLFIA